ncbi:MAG: hypothetical protein OSB25_08615 [Salibacteraceae bacterium]|nr:hypothetical protein [Salibacteraceae bacterium]
MQFSEHQMVNEIKDKKGRHVEFSKPIRDALFMLLLKIVAIRIGLEEL